MEVLFYALYALVYIVLGIILAGIADAFLGDGSTEDRPAIGIFILFWPLMVVFAGFAVVGVGITIATQFVGRTLRNRFKK